MALQTKLSIPKSAYYINKNSNNLRGAILFAFLIFWGFFWKRTFSENWMNFFTVLFSWWLT